MLQNAYFLAKIGADTAENEQHFEGNLPKLATTLWVDRDLKARLKGLRGAESPARLVAFYENKSLGGTKIN